MRLICGLIRLDGADAGDALLAAMIAQSSVQRLRPSVSRWRDGPVALAVIDFSARGAPPLPLARAGSATLAADLRLDAPDALAQDLGLASAADPDAMLLATLGKHGTRGLGGVLGDFAFAAWDASARRLTCGRDVFGVRPFFYVHQPGRLFAFASLPRALHGSGIVPKIVDEDAVLRRITQRYTHDDSLIAGIRRLPPAHVLEVSAEGLSVSRYWQLDRTSIGTSSLAPDEAARELRRLIDDAVRCCLPDRSTIGAHLSGGLDSSSIAVLAARGLRAQGRRLHAYSFLDRQRNDVTLEDETAFVRAVVDQEGDLDWTAVRPTADLGLAAPKDADTMVRDGADDPDGAVCVRAEQQGVDLLLSGWGGDESVTFNGRGAIAELFKRGQWPAMAREIAELRRVRGWPLRNILGGELLHYVLPAKATALMDRARSREATFDDVFDSLLTPDGRRRLAASGGRRLTLAADGRENRWRLMTSPHIAERTETWALMGAAHGIAFAFPLLDRRVVEFALSLPSAMFLRGGYRRRLFRDAMQGVLPEEVRLRHAKYQAFPGVMVDIAESKDDLLAQIDALSTNLAVGRLIDLDGLRRLIQGFPSPDVVREHMAAGRNPPAATALLVASEMLSAAAYIDQHVGRAAAATPVVAAPRNAARAAGRHA